MDTTLYISIPNCFTLFFNTNDNVPDSTPLFNSDGSLNREVLEKKRKEIFTEALCLPSSDNLAYANSLIHSKRRMTFSEVLKGGNRNGNGTTNNG